MPNIKVIGGLKSHATTLKKSALPRTGGAIVHKAVMPQEYLQPAMSASGLGVQTNLETLRDKLRTLNLSSSSGSGQKKKKYIVF